MVIINGGKMHVMKIMIIGSINKAEIVEARSYYQKYIDFFKKSADNIDDIVIETCLIDDLIISVGDGDFSIFDTKNEHDLNNYDVLFLRGDGFRNCIDVIGAINEYAYDNKVTIINDYSGVRDSSKLLQAVQFHQIGVLVARTLLVTSAVLNSEPKLDWGFPCIMKAVHGSHGNDNYFAHSMDEVRLFSEKQADKRFVLQRFIPNNGDYRILIIGNEILAIGRSAVGGSHLNNTSQGGEATMIDVGQIPQKVLEDSRLITEHFKMTIAGVDVLQDKDTNIFYFLEVNAQPQLMSGAFVDQKEKLLGKLISKLSNQS
jgi:glutathione synthase/RimK-type ligase-like ATP-grasp enzyme